MGDEIFTRMDNGAHMYFCGLQGMMPGITEMLQKVSADKGVVWEDKLKEWKKKASGTWRSTKRAAGGRTSSPSASVPYRARPEARGRWEVQLCSEPSYRTGAGASSVCASTTATRGTLHGNIDLAYLA